MIGSVKLIALERVAEILGSHQLIVDDLLGCALRRSFCHPEIISGSLDHAECEGYVVIGDEHRLVELIAKAFYLAAQVLLGSRINGGEGFIQ